MKAIQKTEPQHRLSNRLILARLEIVYRPEDRSHILNNFFAGFDLSGTSLALIKYYLRFKVLICA